MDDTNFLSKILVATDGSVSSLHAEETAVIMAKKTGAAVTVLHVIPRALSYAILKLQYQIPRNILEEVLGHLEQNAERIIAYAQALFNEEGVKVETEIVRDADPAESILEYAKDDFDLLVIGAQGEHEKNPYILGSVTKKVMRHIACAILIAKNVSALSDMLVCVDGSQNSIEALKYAVNLAEKMGSKITLINVQEPQLHMLSPKTAEEIGDQVLTRALHAIPERRMEVEKRLIIGVPSDNIVEAAEKGSHDLIVMGSSGLGATRRFLLGSVSDDVSHKAKSSVLIVPT